MLFYILYKLGESFALAFPVKASYAVASFISDIKYWLSPRERREMVENLKLVLPDEPEKALRRYSREIFINFSRYLVDFFRFKKTDLAYVNSHVEIPGREYIDEGLKKGKGVVILTAHLGSWELGGAVMGLLGYSMNALVLEHKNRRVNNFFVTQRQIKNEKVISTTFALRKCLGALTNNELLAIVGDKDYANSGVVVKFFGKDTLLPKGPAVLSLKTGAAIVPGYTARIKDDKFRLIFERPVEFSPGGNFEEDVEALTGLCARRLEAGIQKYPTQWYCFRRFWLRKEGAG